MNRILIAVFIIVLVISLLVAPGKAVAMGVAIPFAGALILFAYKASQWWKRAAERTARKRDAPALARRRKAILEENRRKAEEIALKNAEADKHARQKDRVKALADASRKDRKQACLQYVAEHLLVDCLIIDSKIWMNDEYGCFFYVLEEACRGQKGYTLALDAGQFDEICGAAKGAEHEPARDLRTRLAVERIEQFQKKGLLTILSTTLDAKRVTDGDSLIVRLLDAATKEGKAITLVTDDRDLRIRARKYLYKSENAKIEVVNIESIAQECREVQAADQSSATVVSP